MTVTASIGIEADRFDLGRALAADDGDVRVELAQFVPIDGGLVPYCWVDAGTVDEREAFERAVRSDDRIAAFARLGTAPERFLYRIEWSTAVSNGDGGFLAALRNHDVLVERAVSTAGSAAWTFRLRTLDREALGRFQRTCEDHGVAFTVRRITHGPAETTDRYGLTDKQREALVLAFDEGYFEVPREVSLTDLADHVGISRQAYTRRLQRALRSYLTETGIFELRGS